MGEAKRRKQILGEAYGKVTLEQIQAIRDENNAKLPKNFLSDFGLEVAAQVGEAPFKLTVLESEDWFIGKSQKTISMVFIPRQFVISGIEEGESPTIIKKCIITIEIATEDESKIQVVKNALSAGLNVKANWGKRFFSQHGMKELVVPLHLLNEEEERLGLNNIADAL